MKKEVVQLSSKTYLKAICLGVIAGMRSMSAPALVSHHLARHQSRGIAGSPFKLLGSPRVAHVLDVAAAGEMIADQLPNIPARISPGPLIARAVSGAVCGASLSTLEGKRADVGMIAGGLAAIASAYAFYHLRRKLGEVEGIPDAVLGLAEDVIVVAGGLSILGDETSAS